MTEGICGTCKYGHHAGYQRDSQGNKLRDKQVIYCELEWSGKGYRYGERYLAECPTVNSDDNCAYHAHNEE